MIVSTKKDENAVAVKTNITIVYDDPAAERALATQALIVKVQGGWRKNGTPANATIKLSEYAPGTRHAGVTDPVELAKSMTPAERTVLIEKLRAMG